MTPTSITIEITSAANLDDQQHLGKVFRLNWVDDPRMTYRIVCPSCGESYLDLTEAVKDTVKRQAPSCEWSVTCGALYSYDHTIVSHSGPCDATFHFQITVGYTSSPETSR